MIKWVMAMVVVVALLIGGLIYSQQRPEMLKVSGFIEADAIQVGSRIGGRVKSVTTVEGEAANIGETLVEFEPFDLLEQQSEAVSKIAERQADYDRIHTGFRTKEIQQAKAAVQAAEDALRIINTQIGELKIKAPVNGIIEAVDLQPGNLVASNAPVIALLDPSHLWVRAYIPENRLSFTVGDKFAVTVDSFPLERFRGRVTYLLMVSPPAAFLQFTLCRTTFYV